jgi:phosphoribosyl-AMP cyclohydrolase
MFLFLIIHSINVFNILAGEGGGNEPPYYLLTKSKLMYYENNMNDKLMFSENAAKQLIAKMDFAKAELLPAIAVDVENGEVLMQAWLNEAAMLETLMSGQVCYYSRSKQALWRKGETSGHVQLLKQVRLDCDYDCVMFMVEQIGAACHTYRRNCFFYSATESGEWNIIAEPIL